MTGGMISATFIESLGLWCDGAGAGQHLRNVNLQNCIFSLKFRNCCSSCKGHHRLGWQWTPRIMAVREREVHDLTSNHLKSLHLSIDFSDLCLPPWMSNKDPHILGKWEAWADSNNSFESAYLYLDTFNFLQKSDSLHELSQVGFQFCSRILPSHFNWSWDHRAFFAVKWVFFRLYFALTLWITLSKF